MQRLLITEDVRREVKVCGLLLVFNPTGKKRPAALRGFLAGGLTILSLVLFSTEPPYGLWFGGFGLLVAIAQMALVNLESWSN